MRRLLQRRLMRRLPWFKVLAVAEVAMLARRHLQALQPAERQRLGELVRHAHRLQPSERDELREIVARLEPRVFAAGAADAFSPVPLPRWLSGRR
jgi:hypothetical protein